MVLVVGRGGGLVVSVLAFYSDDLCRNPAEVCNFCVKLLLKRKKINKKRPGLAHLKKNSRHNLWTIETVTMYLFSCRKWRMSQNLGVRSTFSNNNKKLKSSPMAMVSTLVVIANLYLCGWFNDEFESSNHLKIQ